MAHGWDRGTDEAGFVDSNEEGVEIVAWNDLDFGYLGIGGGKNRGSFDDFNDLCRNNMSCY